MFQTTHKLGKQAINYVFTGQEHFTNLKLKTMTRVKFKQDKFREIHLFSASTKTSMLNVLIGRVKVFMCVVSAF